MKYLALYKLPIRYMLVYTLLILFSGIWIFLLSHELNVPLKISLQSFIEIATPHLFAIGTLIFIVTHFLLFSSKIKHKTSRILSLMLFVMALLNILVYLPSVLGFEVFGWVKGVFMFGFVALFLGVTVF